MQSRPILDRSLLSSATARSGATQLPPMHVLDLPERAVQFGTGAFLRGFVEFGQGDFDYARWIGDGRAYMRLGRPVHLAARLRAGGRFDGEDSNFGLVSNTDTPWQTLVSIPAGSVAETISVTDTGSLSGSARFYRLVTPALP